MSLSDNTGMGGLRVPRKGGRNENERGNTSKETLILKRQGSFLLHWRSRESIYFVTFRLADALPISVVKEWLFERRDIIKTAAATQRPLSDFEQERLEELAWKKIDYHLRKAHGACWMNRQAIADLVATALEHFHGVRYVLFAWSVMPNHVHVVLQPMTGFSLEGILQSWKSFTAHAANRILQRSGHFWQREYYDHLIRNETDFLRCVQYTFSNPDQAGLKNWRWKWKASTIDEPSLLTPTLARDAQATPS